MMKMRQRNQSFELLSYVLPMEVNLSTIARQQQSAHMGVGYIGR